MKNPIAAKLNSRRGASLLLALLFFLICALAASSVLMAAASNAGRARGSREEHQRYLALSSAMRLVCDDLARAQYRGKYQVTTYPEEGPPDENGNPTWLTRQKLTQLDGVYTGALEGLLRPVFDSIFAQQFTPVPNGIDSVEPQIPFSGPVTETLTVTPDILAGSGAEVLRDMPVTVSVTAEDGYRLTLTASLADGYALRAEMAVTTSLPKPANLNPGEPRETGPVLWEISYIEPADAEGEGAGAGG